MIMPEKIYATPNFDRRWQTKAIDDESVEYVRKDAFVEKTSKWIEENIKKWYENINAHGFRGMTPMMIIEYRKYIED